jgi:hypothetical protein
MKALSPLKTGSTANSPHKSGRFNSNTLHHAETEIGREESAIGLSHDLADSNTDGIPRGTAIRDVPVVNSKFKEVWSRAFSRVKARNAVARFS